MHLTIITPSLNYGRFLSDCLESVASQGSVGVPPASSDHPQNDPTQMRAGRPRSLEIEHLVIDGGSTDDSAAVAARFPHVVWTQGSVGVPPASSDHPQSDPTQMRAGRPRSLEIEHLVIDGGSTDDSAAVAARFPHVLWTQEADHGMSHAINKGFDRAKGDWVMWLNADDRLKPGALAAMLPHLSKSSADVVYGDWDFVDKAGIFQRHVTAPGWSRFVHIHHHCYVGSTAAFYRKATVIDEGHRLREDFHYVMDGEYYARLDKAGKRFEHVPVVVADFRMHGDNASQRHGGITRDMDQILAAERQHVESRSIRRAFGITLFKDPYLNGLVDGVLWIVARAWKMILRWW